MYLIGTSFSLYGFGYSPTNISLMGLTIGWVRRPRRDRRHGEMVMRPYRNGKIKGSKAANRNGAGAKVRVYPVIGWTGLFLIRGLFFRLLLMKALWPVFSGILQLRLAFAIILPGAIFAFTQTAVALPAILAPAKQRGFQRGGLSGLWKEQRDGF